MSRWKRSISTILTLFVLGCAGNKAPKGPDEVERPLADNRIPAIQGKAHKSPAIDKRVENVEGIVTAVLSGRSPGFWMQEPEGDGKDETSDAIFVSTEGVETAVSVGDQVSVSGTVAESGREGSLTTTQIREATVSVVASGKELPAPVFVGLKGRRIPYGIATEGFKQYRPERAVLDFWESLEGMRVEVHDPVVVGPTSKYGDLVVLADRGAGAKERSTHGGVVLKENAPNPERIVLDDRLGTKLPSANVGDRFEGSIVGVVDYGFGMYRLLPSKEMPELIADSAPRETTRLTATDDRLTIATYNVLNLSATEDASRFRDLAKSIVVNLASPDVIGLQEIQDDSGPKDDGVVTAKETFGRLIDAIVEAGGPRYDYREIDPENDKDGGQPGGNIRVGLLFNPARVTFVDRGEAGPADATEIEGDAPDLRLSLSPGRVDPTNACFAGGGEGEMAEPTRKSLAAEMRFKDRTFFVVVNHLKSKRGDDSLLGPVQPPALHTEEQRTCQAEVIGSFAKKILEKDPKAAVIVMGDMNEHEFRPPMTKLAEVSGLTNLHDRIIVADRYTFVYEGNSQVLDHIFVSPSLIDGAEVDIVHTNADYAASVAASDHDPILARLKFSPASQ